MRAVFAQGHGHLGFRRRIGHDLLLKADHCYIACYLWTFGYGVSQCDFTRIAKGCAQPVYLFWDSYPARAPEVCSTFLVS